MDRSLFTRTWEHLRDHTAFRVATVYAGASWFLIEAVDTLGARSSTIRKLALLLAVGFIIVVATVWLLSRRSVADAPAKPARSAYDRRRWASAVTILCVVAVGLWALGATVNGGAVPKAATNMAVLPFHATGSAEIRDFGVGMVDLLTTALNDVGGIATVPSRTVLASLRRDGDAAAADAAITWEEALAAGGRLGAGSVLTGSITAFGTEARLMAELRSVADGAVLAMAEVQGPQDSILELTDRLAVGLLRELWRSRAPLPTVRTAGLITTSPHALRAYLRGEHHLRAMRVDSAAHYFRMAVTEDSTFALAWIRRAEATSWFEAIEDAAARREYTRRAVALSDRLPERERAYVRAVDLVMAGSITAPDSLRRYTQRYPDDPLGWYLLGDTWFHQRFLGSVDDSLIVNAFMRSTRLDPNLAVGLHHVIDMSIESGDRDVFDRAIAQYERVASAASTARLRGQATVRWAHPDSVVAAFLGAIDALEPHPVRQRIEADWLVGALGRKARQDPDVDPEVYSVALDSLARRYPHDEYWQQRTANLRFLYLTMRGRFEAGQRELRRWLALIPSSVPTPLREARIRIRLAVQGEIPLGRAAADARLLEEDAVTADDRGMLHWYYMLAGDEARARRYVPRYEPPADLPADASPADSAAMQALHAGWVRIFAGDTLAGLRLISDALPRVDFSQAGAVAVPWFLHAHVLAAVPQHRQVAMRMLRHRTRTSVVMTARNYLVLGRALEAEGDRQGARDAYGHALRIWNGADAHLDDERAEITRALTRLAVE